ncbi:hypothetical protein LEP1GSC045_2349 [Leptospira interrogans serovar Pomona str. Kennewicki LC82-25]|nr:hypothetical protein LEP1GSC045_2349 [Leptospira interrogans serovar Pomona str. Kennewicki LC82-25]EKN97766.1 hypothetical protein LEP1GSC014_3430 [Leptospira interrogans serovar Pomona str. Pomona]EMF34643.1 hypothetical protein LEP1GSC201_1271 [Leptospira interrogans serovar Pomona str. Fox 32256]EMI61205.1 hypothetical protein LEP1GSC200_0801 [Leptospira interrogans serovar Pomona str. CSL10083]EMJ63138.1 hypothetical protein LEP1GSC197_3990 [Leptospira interrogans serovar Pomona str. CS
MNICYSTITPLTLVKIKKESVYVLNNCDIINYSKHKQILFLVKGSDSGIFI